MRFLLLPLTIFLSSTTTPVQGWGKEGHQIVANIAYQRLSPQAQSIIDDILQLDYDKNEDYLSPLAQIADWADEIRIHEEYKWTGRMHYVDVRDDAVQGGCHPREEKEGCTFVYERDCGDDVCAVGAIVNFTNILSGYYHPHDERKEESEVELGGGIRGSKGIKKNDIFANMRQTSLKFLTHIIGDVHQPLHVSRTSDRGGNEITVKLTASSSSTNEEEDKLLYSYPTIDRDGQPLEHHHHSHSHNLHSVWDTTIIEHAINKFYGGSQSSFQAAILQDLPQYLASEPPSSSSCTNGHDVACVSTWANESWDYALNYAYANIDGSEIMSGMEIGEEYLEKRLLVVKKCLGMGGLRLAKVLEDVLGVAENGGDEQGEISLEPLVQGASSS